MDGLLVKNIPKLLLARILVQLYIIPQQLINAPQFDLLAVLAAGLRDYGDGGDMDGFLSFCAQQSFRQLESSPSTSDTTSWKPSSWIWRDHTLRCLNDWDLIDQDQLEEQNSQNRRDTTLDKPTNMIGLRLQLASEKARPQIELVRYGKKVATLHDERFTCVYEGQHISLENILNGTLEYMSNRFSPSIEPTVDSQTIPALLKQRIEQLENNRKEYERRSNGRSETDFVLMGALMVKLDATQTNGATEDSWYLYLRDYTSDISGSNWRIIQGSNTTDEAEMRVSSHQVLADLRGVNVKNEQGLECIPSPTSNNYRPVYLFYCNNDIVSRSAQDSDLGVTRGDKSTAQPTVDENKDQSITLEDYSFDNYDDNGNNMDYETEPDDDLTMEMCKLCGIPESIDNINTIFFCDECNLGVHQLCEQPPIAAFEMNIDPWYCRDCCSRKGIPLPTPPPYITPRSETATATTTTALPPSSPELSSSSTKNLEATTLSPQPSSTINTTTVSGNEMDNTHSHETDASNVKKRKLDN